MKYFACEVCGQVYHYNPPKECMRHDCDSIQFKRIKKKDIIDMHEVWDIFMEKWFKGDYDK